MKVLFIAGHEFLEKQDSGGRQCSYRNYTMLQNCVGRNNIWLCMLSNTTPSDESRHIKSFPTHHSKFEQVKNSLGMRNGYDKKTEKDMLEYMNAVHADLLWFDSSITGALSRKIRGSAKIVVFLHNVERNYMWNRILHRGPAYILPFLSYTFNEKKVIRRTDSIICLNGRDNRILKKWYGRTADFFMPITFTDRFDPARMEQAMEQQKTFHRKKLLFVGSLFAPNYDGIRWFVKNVMPEMENFQLFIVGKDMEKRKSELEADNVDVIGSVEDLDGYYYEADAVVLPIPYGDGMKIKTAEAMMYGKPIFATKEALEGYDVAGVQGIWECNSADGFERKIKEYFHNPEACGYSPAVRKTFLEKYENGDMEKRLKKFLEGVLRQDAAK